MMELKESKNKDRVVKYWHALIEGTDRVIDINDLNDDNRHQFGYCCPFCKGKMETVMGPIRAKHFRHCVEPEPDRCSPDRVLHSLAEHVFFEEYTKCVNEGTPFILSAQLPIKCNNACVLKINEDCAEHYVTQEIDLTSYFKKAKKEASVTTSDDVGGHKRRPDILLETETGRQLWVEIWVNHSDDKKKEEGTVLEIRIQSEEDLKQFYNHRIEESPFGDDKVTLSNKSLFRRLGVRVNKTDRVLPCEEYYVCDFNYSYDEALCFKSSSVLKAEDGHYRLSLRLNWNKTYLAEGNQGGKYDEIFLQTECKKRARNAVLGGNVPSDNCPISSLIESEENKCYKPKNNHVIVELADTYSSVSDAEELVTNQSGPDAINDDCISPQEASILSGLNDAQRLAVKTIDKPLLIVAGAGSGKTKVLTSRVAYILAKGVPPSNVLALTFTKKAAEEMKERIALLIGRKVARGVVMGTFHSVFVRFLREFAGSKCLPYPDSFTIYDRSDSESAVKACVRELGLDDKTYKPREVLSRISSAKNSLLLPADYGFSQEFLQVDRNKKMPRIKDVYGLYQKKLKENGVMDFDDILLNMNILLCNNEDALNSIASRFEYILVDEYQDTNKAQYNILVKLAAKHRRLCVVGDDSQ